MKTKGNLLIYPVLLLGLVLIFNGCKKDNTTANSDTNTITDFEGNVYNYVTIGMQVWTVEYLKTTHYNDGTAIPNVADASEWAGLTTSAYSWYSNDEATYKAIFGTLYNWYAINSGKLCPDGWHVLSDAEWSTLTAYLGGELVAGSSLKESGTKHWSAPNKVTNSSGFTALPGGVRHSATGEFQYINDCGVWWSSTADGTSFAKSLYMFYNASNVSSEGDFFAAGSSVRCIKD